MQPFASADETVARAKMIATHPINAFILASMFGTAMTIRAAGLLFREVVMSGVEIKLARHKRAAFKSLGRFRT
jgi:hypothetical protein